MKSISILGESNGMYILEINASQTDFLKYGKKATYIYFTVCQ